MLIPNENASGEINETTEKERQKSPIHKIYQPKQLNLEKILNQEKPIVTQNNQDTTISPLQVTQQPTLFQPFISPRSKILVPQKKKKKASLKDPFTEVTEVESYKEFNARMTYIECEDTDIEPQTQQRCCRCRCNFF